MDGDGQHPPSELNKLKLLILENRADVVIGSRYITNEGFQSSFCEELGLDILKDLINIC